MTPEENRRRVAALRFKEGQAPNPFPEQIHNSAEALWIKSMNASGKGSKMPRRSRFGRVA